MKKLYTPGQLLLAKAVLPVFLLCTVSFLGLNKAHSQCNHSVIMYDIWGDGWNGGMLTVMLDGIVAKDSITLLSGSGPDTIYFMANDGQEITTTFTCGGWCYECWYEITDGFGVVMAIDSNWGVGPTGILPGTCFANCTDVGIGNERLFNISLKVYPNPSNSVMNIASGAAMNRIELSDPYGRLIQDVEITGLMKHTLDVSAISPGIYLLSIETEQGKISRKVVIE